MSSENKPNENDHISVLKSYTGGPQGYGDPNDRTMRHVESFIFVTQLVKDRSHTEKCKDLIDKWGKCMESNGYSAIIKCHNDVSEMNKCLRYWYTNKEFREECQEMYLEKRKRFRETGIIEKDPKPLYYESTKSRKFFDEYIKQKKATEAPKTDT